MSTIKTSSGSARVIASALFVLGLFVSASPAFAQPRRASSIGVTVFANPNYRGESASFRGDTPDLRPYALNDKISSLEIPRGEAWEVCQDVNYANRCQTFTTSVADLRSIGWNDRISSLRQVRGGAVAGRPGRIYSQNDSGSLVFYDRPGYRGSSAVVTGAASNLGSIGSRATSVEVRGGTWELCARSGRCATIDRSVPDLSRIGLNGRIASVRPVDDRRSGGWYRR